MAANRDLTDRFFAEADAQIKQNGKSAIPRGLLIFPEFFNFALRKIMF
jgi:hypothetical protein